MELSKKSLQTIQKSFRQDLDAAETDDALEQVRIQYSGRKGTLAQLKQQLKALPTEERRTIGPQLKALEREITEAIEAKRAQLKQQQAPQEKKLDVTAYVPLQPQGSLHPYSHVQEELEDLFMSMGFVITDTTEVDTDYYNFEALNIPKNHPARDLHDTFWLTTPGLLMRTHTSTAQPRYMEQHQPPIALVSIGKVYRYEATDASHDMMFWQCEGLFVDTDVSLANLFATMKSLFQKLFPHQKIDIRTRPGYFPFVEPGVEIEMSCPFCSTGCSTCGQKQWLEMGGAGLVHPTVLQTSGIDPDIYSGFAFGFGLTRLVMLKYGINDIRLLHTNKVDFLKQFGM